MSRSRALPVALIVVGGLSVSAGAALVAPWLGLVVFGVLVIAAGLLVDIEPRR